MAAKIEVIPAAEMDAAILAKYPGADISSPKKKTDFANLVRRETCSEIAAADGVTFGESQKHDAEYLYSLIQKLAKSIG